MNILILIISTIVCGELYRLGGKGGFKNAKAIRRFGCPLVWMITFFLLKGFSLQYWYLYLITYILSAVAMSTYHDYLTKDGSEDWKCWLLTGACYALAALPLMWAGLNLFWFIIRVIATAVVTMVWSEIFGNVEIEERGRGWAYLAGIWLYLR